MRDILKNLGVICRTKIIYILALAQITAAGLYAYFIMGLQKPGGLKEAIKFLVYQPDKYTLCFIFGIIALIINIVLIISIITEIPLINDIISEENYNFNYEYPAIKNQVIAKIIVVLVLSILNWVLLKFLFSIMGVIIIALVIMWALTEK